MIKVNFENGEFIVDGSIALGYLGTYCDITVDETLQEILEDMNDEENADDKHGLTWYFLNRYVTEKTEENIAKAIEEYFNAQEKKVKENISTINGQLLFNLYCELEQTHYPFWQDEDLLKGDLGIDSDDDVEIGKFIYRNEIGFNDVKKDYSNMEELFKKALPNFKYKKLFKTIEEDYLTLRGTRMIFQCDDENSEYLCGAYAEITENLEFDDWHNH